MVKFIKTPFNPFGNLIPLNSLTAVVSTMVTLATTFFVVMVYAVVNHNYELPRLY